MAINNHSRFLVYRVKVQFGPGRRRRELAVLSQVGLPGLRRRVRAGRRGGRGEGSPGKRFFRCELRHDGVVVGWGGKGAALARGDQLVHGRRSHRSLPGKSLYEKTIN